MIASILGLDFDTSSNGSKTFILIISLITRVNFFINNINMYFVDLFKFPIKLILLNPYQKLWLADYSKAHLKIYVKIPLILSINLPVRIAAIIFLLYFQ